MIFIIIIIIIIIKNQKPNLRKPHSVEILPKRPNDSAVLNNLHSSVVSRHYWKKRSVTLCIMNHINIHSRKLTWIPKMLVWKR